MFPDERDKNLLKLLLYLLTINPRARIPAKQALMNPFFQEVSSFIWGGFAALVALFFPSTCRLTCVCPSPQRRAFVRFYFSCLGCCQSPLMRSEGKASGLDDANGMLEGLGRGEREKREEGGREGGTEPVSTPSHATPHPAPLVFWDVFKFPKKCGGQAARSVREQALL